MLSTDGDWLRDLAADLRRAEQMRRAAIVAGGPGRAGDAARAVPGAPGARAATSRPVQRASRLRRRAAPAPPTRRMSFRQPTVLLGLALLPMALLAYLAVQKRRRREAAASATRRCCPA